MGAASAAAWITSPLDMAKLRLQVQRSTDLMFGYKHMVHGLGLIREKEGLLGLWKGAGARVAFVAPYSAVIICTYDSIKLFLARDRLRNM